MCQRGIHKLDKPKYILVRGTSAKPNRKSRAEMRMKMEQLLEEKKEAVEVAREYLEKLIPGMETLCGELKGDRQPDTDDFQKQCIDGLNWVIEIYNRTSDVMNAEKIRMEKQELNARLTELGTAIRDKEDGKIAQMLEDVVIPFLKDLKEAAKI